MELARQQLRCQRRAARAPPPTPRRTPAPRRCRRRTPAPRLRAPGGGRVSATRRCQAPTNRRQPAHLRRPARWACGCQLEQRRAVRRRRPGAAGRLRLQRCSATSHVVAMTCLAARRVRRAHVAASPARRGSGQEVAGSSRPCVRSAARRQAVGLSTATTRVLLSYASSGAACAQGGRSQQTWRSSHAETGLETQAFDAPVPALSAARNSCASCRTSSDAAHFASRPPSPVALGAARPSRLCGTHVCPRNACRIRTSAGRPVTADIAAAARCSAVMGPWHGADLRCVCLARQADDGL